MRYVALVLFLCGNAAADDSAPFPDFSFEQGVVGWTFESGRAVELHHCGQSEEVSSSQLRLGGKPLTSLGGDYWDVPFPSVLDAGQLGNCWLVVPANSSVRSPKFALPAGQTYVTVLAWAQSPGSVIELRSQDDRVIGSLKVPVSRSFRPLSLNGKAAQAGVTLVVRTAGASLGLDQVRRAAAPLK